MCSLCRISVTFHTVIPAATMTANAISRPSLRGGFSVEFVIARTEYKFASELGLFGVRVAIAG